MKRRILAPARAFTLIDLLAALLLPALARAKEKALQAVCMNNFSQIAKASEMYVGDHGGVYLPTRHKSVQTAMDPPQVAAWVPYNLVTLVAQDRNDPSDVYVYNRLKGNNVLTCPGLKSDVIPRGYKSNLLFPSWEKQWPSLMLGFQYFGGIEVWNNPSGQFKSRSPVNTGNVQGQWVIASDATLRVDSKWGGGRPTAFGGMPPHQNNAGIPKGGNQAHVDGSVTWMPFRKMVFLHSWNPGARNAYAFQDDLGDYGTSGRVVSAIR